MVATGAEGQLLPSPRGRAWPALWLSGSRALSVLLLPLSGRCTAGLGGPAFCSGARCLRLRCWRQGCTRGHTPVSRSPIPLSRPHPRPSFQVRVDALGVCIAPQPHSWVRLCARFQQQRCRARPLPARHGCCGTRTQHHGWPAEEESGRPALSCCYVPCCWRRACDWAPPSQKTRCPRARLLAPGIQWALASSRCGGGRAGMFGGTRGRRRARAQTGMCENRTARHRAPSDPSSPHTSSALLHAQEEWRGEIIHLSWSPRAFLLKGFLSDEECEHIIAKVRGGPSVCVGVRARMHACAHAQVLMSQARTHACWHAPRSRGCMCMGVAQERAFCCSSSTRLHRRSRK